MLKKLRNKVAKLAEPADRKSDSAPVHWARAYDLRRVFDTALVVVGQYPSDGLTRKEREILARADALLEQSRSEIMALQVSLSKRCMALGIHEPAFKEARQK